MTSGYVYFIQRGEGGPVKIGFSGSPLARMAALQVGCPDRLHLLGALQGTREVERGLHVAFAAHRLDGEWFQPAVAIVELARGCEPLPESAKLNRSFDLDGLRERIVARRKQLGFSQRAVCDAAGLSNAYVSILERGASQVISDPGISAVCAIARALDVCPGWLAFGIGDAPEGCVIATVEAA